VTQISGGVGWLISLIPEFAALMRCSIVEVAGPQIEGAVSAFPTRLVYVFAGFGIFNNTFPRCGRKLRI
jgi:hypothetical protein